MFNLNEKQRFSLRKLSVGLASVCIGLSFVNMTSKEVKADTVSVQTSAAETKTNKNNKADANADASKEVANATNSVDSNKITPSQTVLNKQVTSNDVLKGTDVKQDAQEPPVKPAVSNKDANIKINSNLNKNTIKQALADSLLKDTTKPETTTLDVAKTSQAPVNAKAIVEDKTQATQNQDWADPAKQGFVKTIAGWTKLQQGKDYDAVAKNTNIKLFETKSGSNSELSSTFSDVDFYLKREYGSNIEATIAQNDYSAGKRILVASIPVLYSDHSRKVDWQKTMASQDVVINDKKIGSLNLKQTADQWAFILTITDKEKLAKDANIHYVQNSFVKCNYFDNGMYSGLVSQTSHTPLSLKMITSQNNSDHSYTEHIDPYIYNTNWNSLNNSYQYAPRLNAEPQNKALVINTTDVDAKKWGNLVLKRVFKIQSFNKDNLVSIASNTSSDLNYIHALQADNKALSNEWIIAYSSANNIKQLSDGLTANLLLSNTNSNSITWSKQSDGSVLLAINVSNHDYKLTPEAVTKAVKSSYWYSIVNSPDKDQILQSTLNTYNAHNYVSPDMNVVVPLNWDSSKAVKYSIMDVTPNASNKVGTLTKAMNANGIVDSKMPKITSINIKYVDDTNPSNHIDSDVMQAISDVDSTFTIGKDISFPSNMLLSDSQPDLARFNYNANTKSFHYGVVKSTNNPDIVIHVKHKIVKNVSGDDEILDNYPEIKKALNVSIKLVANYTYPDNGKFTDERVYPKQRVNSLTLKRSADVDLTTDSIVSGTAGVWSAVNQNGITFNNGLASSGSNFGETLPEGYTLQNGSDTTANAFNTDAFQTSARNAFASLRNAGGSVTKVFNYVIKADPQKIQVKFVDDDDPNKAQVGDIITLNGVTDGKADFKDVISAYNQDQAKHYDLGKDQTDPNELTHIFSANDSTVLTVHLKHQHAKSTAQAPATRTIIVHMPDGTTKIYVQTIGFVNNLDKDLVTNKTTNIYTVDASKSNVTVNGTVDSSIHAYRKTGNDDATGTNYKFASFVLPKIPGYTAHIKPVSINPNMRLFSVSFMAIPQVTPDVTQKVKPEPVKPAPIETQIPVETHDSLSNYTLTTNDPIPDTRVFNNIESNELTWQIVNKNLNSNSINIPYNLTNTIYKLRLPRFNNYELHLVKRGTTQDSVSFVYINKQTQLNYVFNLKIQDNKYCLTVGKIDRVNRKILPIKTYNVISYQDLLDIFDKYFK